eukprot:12905-Amphidinium_carterae.1
MDPETEKLKNKRTQPQKGLSRRHPRLKRPPVCALQDLCISNDSNNIGNKKAIGGGSLARNAKAMGALEFQWGPAALPSDSGVCVASAALLISNIRATAELWKTSSRSE